MELEEAIQYFLHYFTSIERSPRTITNYGARLLEFRRHFEQELNGPVYLEDITTATLESYLAYLKVDRELSPATRKQTLYAIRSLFQYLELRKMITVNPASPLGTVKVPQKERNYLNEFQLEQLAAHISSPRMEVICRTLFGTGLRISECLNLTLDDVNLEKQQIHVKNGKGGKDRIVPIGDKLTGLLRKYLKEQRPRVSSPLFFVTPRGRRVLQDSVNKALQGAAKSLGWSEEVTAHILRHSYASRLIKTGANLVQVQKLLGHSSLAVTGLYTHASLEELSEAVNRL